MRSSVDYERISNTYFLMKSNDQVITNQFQFHKSGFVSGYNSNNNEYRWRVEGEKLVIMDSNGNPSTIIDHYDLVDGHLILSGKFKNRATTQVFIEQLNYRPKPFVKKVTITKKLLTFLEQESITFERWVSGERLNVGDRLALSSTLQLENFTSFDRGNNLFSMGSYSYSGSSLPPETEIGRYSSIAPNVKVMGFQHPIERFSTSHVTYGHHFPVRNGYKKLGEKAKFVPVSVSPKQVKVIIGHDVWVGEDVTLKQGITIGNGAVIASGAIVTKDVPAFTVVGGVPARGLKDRFEEEEKKALLMSKWWDYNILEIPMRGDLKPKEFLRYFDEYRNGISMLGETKVTLDTLLHNL